MMIADESLARAGVSVSPAVLPCPLTPPFALGCAPSSSESTMLMSTHESQAISVCFCSPDGAS
jgi:hypothetical protein